MAIQEPENQTPLKHHPFPLQQFDNQLHKFHIKIDVETFYERWIRKSVEKNPHLLALPHA